MAAQRSVWYLDRSHHDSPASGKFESLVTPERFYWAVLDTAAIDIHRPTARQLGYLFESTLPLPIEQVHAAYARIFETRQFIACGIARDKLHYEVAASGGEIVTLAPTAIPKFIHDQLGDAVSTVNPQFFNLLVSDFEPAIVRKLKQRWLIRVTAAIAFIVFLIVGGFERRTRHLALETEAVRNAQRDILGHVLVTRPGVGDRVHDDLRLTTELRTLRQTRKQPTILELSASNSSASLAALLAHWPKDLHFQTELLQVSSTAISIRGAASTSADVQSLAQSLQRMRGWEVQQPQVNSGRDSINATLLLTTNKEQSP